jgi:hypothetical protein
LHFSTFARPRKEKRAQATREWVPRPKKKADPKLIAAARELRDRWLEEVNKGTDGGRFLPQESAKYDIARQIAQAIPARKPAKVLRAA